MALSLNNSTAQSGSYVGLTDNLYISIGGPIFTIFQAIIFLVIVEKTKSIYVFPFVFFAVFSRIFSIVFGGFTLQDESRIATLLDFGKYSIAIFVILLLILIVWRGCYLLKINLKGIGYYAVLSVISILIVISVYNM